MLKKLLLISFCLHSLISYAAQEVPGASHIPVTGATHSFKYWLKNNEYYYDNPKGEYCLNVTFNMPYWDKHDWGYCDELSYCTSQLEQHYDTKLKLTFYDKAGKTIQTPIKADYEALANETIARQQTFPSQDLMQANTLDVPAKTNSIAIRITHPEKSQYDGDAIAPQVFLHKKTNIGCRDHKTPKNLPMNDNFQEPA